MFILILRALFILIRTKLETDMKHTSLLMLLWLGCTMCLDAQTLSFIVDYDEVQTVRGELYQYSERYLGTTKVITESGTTYALRGIRMSPSSPDSLQGSCRSKAQSSSCPKRDVRPKKSVVHIAALSEDALMATNTSKKAESVAKQIYRIREARMSLISGESEHTPADGKAMELALRELNRQEEELTALFVGTTYTTRHTATVEYTLSDSLTTHNQDMLLRFSRFSGPVATDDLSGEPVLIEQDNTLAQRPAVGKKAKKGETETYIQSGTVRVSYANKELLKERIPF